MKLYLKCLIGALITVGIPVALIFGIGRYNSAHSQCAELQRARRHAESASPMGGVPASQVYWAAAPRQARGSALNSNYRSYLQRDRHYRSCIERLFGVSWFNLQTVLRLQRPHMQLIIWQYSLCGRLATIPCRKHNG